MSAVAAVGQNAAAAGCQLRGRSGVALRQWRQVSMPGLPLSTAPRVTPCLAWRGVSCADVSSASSQDACGTGSGSAAAAAAEVCCGEAWKQRRAAGAAARASSAGSELGPGAALLPACAVACSC